MRFRALQTFASPETRSVYVVGQVYTIRTPELRVLANGWMHDGRVVFVPDGQTAGMSGGGAVAPARPWWRRVFKWR